MIQANELRIGNWVDTVYNIPYIKITEIKESVICGKNCKGMSYGSLKPILLTEEILLRCGFENEIDEIDGKVYNIYFVTNTDYLIEYFHKDKKYIFTDDMGIKVDIKYVHKLQNLYHALTCQELKIEL